MVGTQLSSVYATLYRLACGMQGPTKITENRMIRSLALLVTCCNMAYGLYMILDSFEALQTITICFTIHSNKSLSFRCSFSSVHMLFLLP